MSKDKAKVGRVSQKRFSWGSLGTVFEVHVPGQPQPIFRHVKDVRVTIAVTLTCGHALEGDFVRPIDLLNMREPRPCWKCIKTKREAPKRGKGKR